MADNVCAVPIGKIVVSDAPDDVLVAYGVGSCVAVCLYDPVARVGGMLHALLPSAPDNRKSKTNPGPAAKFVDQGISALIESLLKLGARRTRLVAQLCGGAQVLSAPGFDGRLNVGQRNVRAAETALEAAGLRVRAQVTGGDVGRTVRFYVADGRMTLRSMGRKERPIEEHRNRGGGHTWPQ